LIEEKIIKKIKKDYLSGVPKEDILKKHNITLGQLNYQIKKNDWIRRKKKGSKGNKGGHGTKGNQNAVVTGAYSKLLMECFSEDEMKAFNEPIKSKQEILEEEIKMLKIRKIRMMNRIKELTDKKKDLTVMRMSKYGSTTSTEAENTQILLERMEAALTKVQDAIRKATDSLHRIEIEHEKLDFEKSKIKDNNPSGNTERIEIINDLPIEDELENEMEVIEDEQG
jgi:uncharacterized protein YjcR